MIAPTQWALELLTTEGREGNWEKQTQGIPGRNFLSPRARDLPHKHVGELSALENAFQLAKLQPAEGAADHVEISIILELRHPGRSLEGWLVLVLHTIALVFLIGLGARCSRTDIYETKSAALSRSYFQIGFGPDLVTTIASCPYIDLRRLGF